MITTDTISNSGINQTLANLEAMLNTTGRVDFVIHFWKEFPNLGKDGLEFKTIDFPTIPRMAIIPIVATKTALGSSRTSEGTRKIVAGQFEYMREANHAVTDLIQRFAGHSLVHIDGFNFNVTEVKRAGQLYSALMAGLPDNPNMEQVAQYFGIDLGYAISPYKIPSAQEMIDAVMKSDKLSDAETLKFASLVKWVVKSASTAVMMAVEPTFGRLPVSIRLINEGRRHRLDGTDVWLGRQFPNFDTSSRINTPQRKTNNDSTEVLNRLADILQGRSAKGEDDMPIQKRYTDALPTENRPDNWDDLPESNKMTLTDNYLSRINNMTVQPEDSVGMTADEMHNPSWIGSPLSDLKGPPATEDSNLAEAGTDPGTGEESKSPEPDDNLSDGASADTGTERKLCSARTVAGTPCKNYAVEGSDKCLIHNKPLNEAEGVITPPPAGTTQS